MAIADIPSPKKLFKIELPVIGSDLRNFDIYIPKTIENYIVSVRDFPYTKVHLSQNTLDIIKQNGKDLVFHESHARTNHKEPRTYYNIHGNKISTSITATKIKKIDLTGKQYDKTMLSTIKSQYHYIIGKKDTRHYLKTSRIDYNMLLEFISTTIAYSLFKSDNLSEYCTEYTLSIAKDKDVKKLYFDSTDAKNDLCKKTNENIELFRRDDFIYTNLKVSHYKLKIEKSLIKALIFCGFLGDLDKDFNGINILLYKDQKNNEQYLKFIDITSNNNTIIDTPISKPHKYFILSVLLSKISNQVQNTENNIKNLKRIILQSIEAIYRFLDPNNACNLDTTISLINPLIKLYAKDKHLSEEQFFKNYFREYLSSFLTSLDFYTNPTIEEEYKNDKRQLSSITNNFNFIPYLPNNISEFDTTMTLWHECIADGELAVEIQKLKEKHIPPQPIDRSKVSNAQNDQSDHRLTKDNTKPINTLNQKTEHMNISNPYYQPVIKFTNHEVESGIENNPILG